MGSRAEVGGVGVEEKKTAGSTASKENIAVSVNAYK